MSRITNELRSAVHSNIAYSLAAESAPSEEIWAYLSQLAFHHTNTSFIVDGRKVDSIWCINENWSLVRGNLELANSSNFDLQACLLDMTDGECASVSDMTSDCTFDGVFQPSIYNEECQLFTEHVIESLSVGKFYR